MKQKLIKLLGYIILTGIVLLVIIGLALLASVIMGFFGFTYDSPVSLVLFFAVCAVFGFPLELISKALPRALFSMGKVSIKEAKLLFVVLDTISTIIIMLLVDQQMDSIYASDSSIVIIALLMALFTMNDLEEDKKRS